jgi:2-(1,2-epoxy-1,2-dihydrophenyl)acetyl-CoA isomerase
MPEYTALTFDLTDNVATITLNRPEAANALNFELARDLMYASLECDEDPNIRAVVITGAGRFFCAGGDLKSFAAAPEMPVHLKEVTTYLHAAVSRFTRMDAPVIGAINGVAAGAGMSLACSCDIVLAAESSRFTMAYTRAGLTPDGSSTYFLSRAVGLKKALELTLTNRMLSAQEAEDYGIVTRVVADDDLASETASLATQLASGATLALGAAKRLLHDGWTGTLETQMELETRAIADMARTADAKEGISAFIEKRDPNFTGR